MARTSITIVLELDPAADIPAGSARLPGETPRRFHGWLGLAEAIDSLTGMSARGDATSIFGPSAAKPGSADGQPTEGSAS
jgi:hypothetical protein